jgi:hypothetical protein
MMIWKRRSRKKKNKGFKNKEIKNYKKRGIRLEIMKDYNIYKLLKSKWMT